MPRRARKVVKRVIAPDARYGSLTVAKFINKIMLRGQKATAERIAYDALLLTAQQLNSAPVEVLEQAIGNATPTLMVKPRRVGGATYQVPVETERGRGRSLAMRWLIQAAKNKKGKTMKEKLAEELTSASKNEGAAVKKKTDTHRMAEANRAFAHFAW